jgi:hypothetical protein
MSDRYDKIKEDVSFRKQVADESASGSNCHPQSSIAPIAPKLSEEVAIVTAA